MDFIPFNNTIRLAVYFGQDGQNMANIYHYIVDETPDATTALDLAETFKETWDANVRSLVANTVTLNRIVATIMENENDPSVEYTTGLPMAGGNSEPALPNNVSVAVRWNTNFRGRSFKGRTYHIGLTETQVTGNTISAGIISNLLTAYGELMTLPVDVGPAVLGVASRVSHGLPRTTGVITPVTSVFINSIVDSQRRRLPGRGR